MISYSNDVKKAVLGVSGEILERLGAVSEPVAIQMAQGVAEHLGADWGIGITGIAGPDGGTETKPVGLVYIAVHHRNADCWVKKNFDFVETAAKCAFGPPRRHCSPCGEKSGRWMKG